MGRGHGNANVLEEAAGAQPAAQPSSPYNNFFKEKMAEIDRVAEGFGPSVGMQPEDMSDIMKKGGLALLAGTVVFFPVGTAAALAYVGFRSVKAWKAAREPALDEMGQPLVDPMGNPIDKLGRPMAGPQSMTKALRNAGLGGLAVGGLVAAAAGAPFLPVAAAGALGALAYKASQGWKKETEEQEAPTASPQDQNLFAHLASTEEGQKILESGSLAIWRAGGLRAGEEACIKALQSEMNCDVNAAKTIYDSVRGGVISGALPEDVYMGAPVKGEEKEAPPKKAAKRAEETKGNSEDKYSSAPPKPADTRYLCRAPLPGPPGRFCRRHASKGGGPCSFHKDRKPLSVEEANMYQNPSVPKEEGNNRARVLEAVSAAESQGVPLTPEFISSYIDVNQEEAEIIFSDIREKAPEVTGASTNVPEKDQVKAPRPENITKARSLKTKDQKNNENKYKAHPPANDSQKEALQLAANKGDVDEVTSLFDQAYFSPQERLDAIRKSHEVSFVSSIERIEEQKENVAICFERAGLKDAAERVRSASNSAASIAAQSAFESHLRVKPMEYWQGSTIKEQRTSALNKGLGKIANSVSSDEDIRKVLSPKDYEKYQESVVRLSQAMTISPERVRAALLSPLAETKGKVSKAKNKTERSAALLAAFQDQVNRSLNSKN